jgi:predicted protein tyrosine phosphatase
MPAIYVCPLSQIAPTVASARASHLVSVINADTIVTRPESILAANHLFLGMNDITEPQEGMIFPGAEHVSRLIDFAESWDRKAPMVVHCFAGISRSSAAAFITLCIARPERDEADIARRFRQASPFVTPNTRLVALADEMLNRNGRMVAAVAAIGRGATAIESIPFGVALEATA